MELQSTTTHPLQSTAPSGGRTAFTIVELLVVIANDLVQSASIIA
jgi:hypothetical protein